MKAIPGPTGRQNREREVFLLHSLDPAKFLRQTYFRSPVGTVNSQYHRSKGGHRKRTSASLTQRILHICWCGARQRQGEPPREVLRQACLLFVVHSCCFWGMPSQSMCFCCFRLRLRRCPAVVDLRGVIRDSASDPLCISWLHFQFCMHSDLWIFSNIYLQIQSSTLKFQSEKLSLSELVNAS